MDTRKLQGNTSDSSNLIMDHAADHRQEGTSEVEEGQERDITGIEAQEKEVQGIPEIDIIITEMTEIFEIERGIDIVVLAPGLLEEGIEIEMEDIILQEDTEEETETEVDTEREAIPETGIEMTEMTEMTDTEAGIEKDQDQKEEDKNRKE